MDQAEGPSESSAAPVDELHMFHRVSSLLPSTAPLTVPPDQPVSAALKMMHDAGFSQLPVVAGNEVLGLFSHRAFTTKLVEQPWLLERTKSASTLVVEDFTEPATFVRAVDGVDTLFALLDHDGAVLVGDPNRLEGIVTSSDVIAYLYRVAAPYMLLKEIEVGLRALISAAVTTEQLAECATTALASLYRGREDKIPTSLGAMTFDEQVGIVVNTKNWPLFAPLMGANRDMVNYEIRPVGPLRNDVFHFKRELEDDDLQRLVTARSWVLRKLRRKAGQST